MQLQSTEFCASCQEKKLMARKGVNHALHAILAVLTGLAWLPFYVVIVVINHMNHEWRCQTCGTENSDAKTPLFEALTKQVGRPRY